MVLHGRVVRKLEALYDEIVAAGHPEPVILPLDLAKAVADDFGNVADGAAGAAGPARRVGAHRRAVGVAGPIEHQSFDSWLSLLRVNVAAPMGLTRALMPMLDAAPDASVVFTLDNRGRAAARVLGRLRGDQGRRRHARARTGRRVGEPPAPAHQCGDSRPDPLAAAGPDAPGRGQAVLPAPDALVPLYLHLLAGQTKADSGQLVDAQAWLAGAPCATALRA